MNVPTHAGSAPGSTAQRDARTARFWDRMAKGYAAKSVSNPEAYAHKLAVTREYLTADSDLLEIGCGTGSTAIAHAPYVRSILATDLSAAMLHIAQDKVAASHLMNVELARRSALEACRGDAEYDAVLALSVLHLLPDWREVLAGAYGTLRAGGVLVTSTLCLRDDYVWLRWVAPFGRAVRLMPQLSYFSKVELRQELLQAGFEIDRSWQADGRGALFIVAKKPC